jgi:hypothetical protein
MQAADVHQDECGLLDVKDAQPLLVLGGLLQLLPRLREGLQAGERIQRFRAHLSTRVYQIVSELYQSLVACSSFCHPCVNVCKHSTEDS